MAAKRFSQFDEVLNPTGDEEIVGVSNGQNIRFHVNKIKSLVTKTDIGLDQVDNTSDINKPISTATQGALNGKSGINHTHTAAQLPEIQDALDTKADLLHQHGIDDVTDLQTALDAKADTLHGHAIGDVAGLQTELNNKASTLHQHNMSDVTGLASALASKADTVHNHSASEIADLDQHIADVLQNAGIVAGDVSVDNLEW